MSVTVLVDLFFGDCGKGMLVDTISDNFDMVVRWGSGGNAGHTLQVGEQKVVLNHIPSGVLREHTKNVLAQGMVIDVVALAKEIKQLKNLGINLDNRLFISNKAHAVTPINKWTDQNSSLSKEIGTTGKGIGPTYRAKAERSGIRIHKLLSNKDYSFLRSLVKTEEQVREISEAVDVIKEYVTDTAYLVNASLSSGENILLEGAQGSWLDQDHGTYPYCTSTNTVSGSACVGAGISPLAITEILGLTKAYSTRVGSGAFPTEVFNSDEAKHLATVGKEFGAVTGRPRRVGWLDLPMLKYAIMVNGCSYLAMTKLDVLSGLKEIKVCTGYKQGPLESDIVPYNLASVTPSYQVLPGWEEDISQVKQFVDLPKAAQEYVLFVEEKAGVPINIISVGPERNQVLDGPGLLREKLSLEVQQSQQGEPGFNPAVNWNDYS